MEMKVMVPVDFSPVSDRALQFLEQITGKAKADLHLVHVIQVNEADWAGSAELSETLDQEALQNQVQQAEHKFAELKSQLPYSAQTRILFGGLTTALINYAAAIAPDLIVMGTRGADGLLEKISGSEAQQIVRHAQVPVVTVHEHASLSLIKNLLWVADFNVELPQQSEQKTLLALQQLFQAKLHLLRILKPGDNGREEQISQQMHSFATKHNLQNFELHLHHDSKVPHGVREFNQATDMDLVMIGTYGRNGISQLFFGSIAETLVNHCIRPLLTYHLK